MSKVRATPTARVAGLYLRVSTAEQRDKGNSLAEQEEQLRAAAKDRGLVVREVYVDAGISGTAASRPALDRLLGDAASGLVNVVLVSKMDRLARDEVIRILTIRELQKHKVEFVALDMPGDASTAEGEMISGILGVIAQFERRRILQRTVGGQRMKAHRGEWPGGAPPYGFRLVGRKNECRCEIDPDEAQVLQQIIAWMVDDGLSTGEVCRRLNAMGVKPRDSKTWRHQNLRRMVANRPGMMGYIWYGDPNGQGGHRASGEWGERIKVPIPAIISEERYQAFQAALARKTTGKQKDRKVYPLGGRLYAPCGSRYGGTSRDDIGYELRQYLCSGNRWSSDGRERCHDPRLRADDVEEAVWQEVITVLTEPSRLLGLTSEYLSLHATEVTVDAAQLDDLDQRIAQHKRAIATVVTDYARAGVPASAVADATATLQAELDQLEEMKLQLRRWQRESDAEAQRHRDLHTLAETVLPRLQSMNREERAEVFRLLDVRVKVQDKSATPALKVEGRISYEALSSVAMVGAAPTSRTRNQGNVDPRCHRPHARRATTR